MSYKDTLNASHYLGAKGARARHVYQDEHGLIVFSSPASRRLPASWLELSRWCLLPGGKGSQQWSACLQDLARAFPKCTTVVSYSDPSQGHSGGLYRACNWVWAPVWHQLRPPPSGLGTRGGKRQEVKARWVYLLRPDSERGEALRLKDVSLAKRYPWAGYTEPAWRRGRPVLDGELMQRPKLWQAAEKLKIKESGQ